MSAFRWYVRCVHPGCNMSLGDEKSSNLHARAREAGWLRLNEMNYCPGHRAMHEVPKDTAVPIRRAMLTEQGLLEIIRKLREDPCAGEVAKELSARADALKKENSPMQYTYNKLWWLFCGEVGGP